MHKEVYPPQGVSNASHSNPYSGNINASFQSRDQVHAWNAMEKARNKLTEKPPMQR